MGDQHFNIAIDGPAGAGKSTIAKLVAKELGFIYVDTGAMYRAIALFMLRERVPLSDEAAVSAAAERTDITIRYEEGTQRVLLNGEDVSGLIRTEEVGKAASRVSACPAVRAHLLKLQRGLAAAHCVVMDGRDIGTCILPGAQLKIYLTASVQVRALRRFKELQEKGESCILEQIERDIRDRDRNDMNRAVSPLRQAEDAVLLDGSGMTIREVTEAILSAAKEHGLEPCHE